MILGMLLFSFGLLGHVAEWVHAYDLWLALITWLMVYPIVLGGPFWLGVSLTMRIREAKPGNRWGAAAVSIIAMIVWLTPGAFLYTRTLKIALQVIANV